MTDNPRANYELALRIARLEGQVKSRVPQLAFTTLEAGAITEVDQMGNVVASYGQQYDGSHIAMSYVGVTPLEPTPAIVTPGPGELEVEWLGTWVDNGVVPTDFTRVEVHASADPLYLADESTTLYDTIETPRGAVVRLRLPAGVPMYIRFVARNLAGQRGPASVPVAGTPGAIMDQAAIDALQADVDAIPADIAAAKAEAISTAATDATAKANQAEQDAIAAAALDAQAKANQAEADAIAAAALTAQQKADLAEADAIAAAAADATTKANAARQQAIDSAALTSQEQADLAEAQALAGSIPRAAGAVTETYLAADAVTATKIKAGSVIAGKLAADSVLAANIKAGEISASKLAVGDLSNMAEINEVQAGLVSWGNWTHALETVGSAVWSVRSGGTAARYEFMFRSQKGPVPFKAGDRIRLTFAAFSDTAVASTSVKIWTYRSDGTLIATINFPAVALNTTATSYAMEADVTAAAVDGAAKYVIGFDGNVDQKIVRVRNVRAYIMGAGELIVDGSISASKILAGAVTTDKLDALAVTTVKLAAGAVIAEKIAAGAITSEKILAGEVTAGKLAAASVIAGNIATDAVTASTIVAGAISAEKLATDSVTAIKILAGSIVTDKIATDAVTAIKILAGSITTAKLDALAVTADKVAANAITADKVSAGAIIAGKLAAGAVIAGNIAADAVTASNIVAGAIKAKHLTLGDTSNLAEINEFESIGYLWGSYNHTLTTEGNGTRWSNRSVMSDDYFMFRRSTGPVTFRPGEKIRLTFEAFAATGFDFYCDLHTYDANGAYLEGAGFLKPDSGALLSTAGNWARQTYTLTATVPPGADTAVTWTFGLRGVANKDILVRNVQARVMNAGKLVVDGSIDGITITGSVLQTAYSGSRMVIGPDPRDITAPGRLEWWDDHTTAPTEDIPPGIWGGLTNKGNAQEQYAIGLSSGRTVGAGDAVLWMRARSRQAGSKSQVDLQAEVINFNGVGQVVTIAGDLSVNGKGIVVSSMQPAYGTGGTFTSTGAGLSSSTEGASFTFVAPASGRVFVTTQGYLRVATAGQSAQLGFEIREGGTLRSGTLITGTDITRTVANYNTQYIGGSRRALVSGLTPGATYNCYQTFNSSAANAVYTGLSLLLEHSV